jgi:hypothetical protein
MGKVSQKEYLAAKKVVDQYQLEQYRASTKTKVQLSDFGKTMQKAHNKIGVIVNKSLAGQNDYSVQVLWSDNKLEWMHEHQVKEVSHGK